LNFLAIDFETANRHRSSACAIGIIEVRDGEIVDTFYSLIDPDDYFDEYHISIHGITPDMVKGKPTFDELWNDIRPRFEGKRIVAHNASYDMSVLRYCLDKTSRSYPSLQYFCTYFLSKKIVTGLPSYRLDLVADHFGISFNHHDALEDARAAAIVMMRLQGIGQVTDPAELSESVGYRIGELFDGGYNPFSIIKKSYSSKSSKLKSKDISTDNTEFDESHLFFDQTVVFTGTLTSMVRREAMQKVVDVGGICADSVNKHVNFLVIGIQDFARFKEGTKSSKLKRAEQLIFDGHDLEIIDEDEFLRML
jgi:DNA polymerase-3 subunit epsilon